MSIRPGSVTALRQLNKVIATDAAVFTTEDATTQDVQRPKSVFNAPSIGVHCAELSRGTSCPRSITLRQAKLGKGG